MSEPPSKRRRTNSPEERASSPLKQPPRRRPSFASPTKASLARGYPKLLDSTSPTKQSPLKSNAPPVLSDNHTRTLEDGPTEDETQIEAQKREPLDPEVERRRREKARLEREVEELEAEMSRCTDEIRKEQQRKPDEALRPSERTELNNLISKLSGTDVESEKPPPVSSLLCSFLPFSAIPVSRPCLEQSAKPVPSHRPIELADPLPYLEMFTSFKFSTQLGLPRAKVSPTSRRVHQKHAIDIVGPQKLLTAQVAVTVDAVANEVIDMHVLRLSQWAERELGTFLREKAQEKDLGNACWAFDSYWEIAKKRAQYWQKCEATFANLMVGRTREDIENRPLANQAKTISRKDLNRHLGRDTLVLQDKHVLLKLNWRIVFDWTGEAASEINVEPAFPQVWSETDDASHFKKIPETFTSLVHSKGAFQATRVMVTLLFH